MKRLGKILWTAPGSDPAEAAAWKAAGAAEQGRLIGDSLAWRFDPNGPERSYISRQLSLEGSEHLSLSLALRLSGWRSSAVTVGWQDREDNFWRVRLPHIRDGEWQQVELLDASLEFAIHNSWTRPKAPLVSAIRVVAVGEPGSAASLEIRSLEVRSLTGADVTPRLLAGSELYPIEQPGQWSSALDPRPRDRVLHRYLGSDDLLEDSGNPVARAGEMRDRGLYRLESAKPVAPAADWAHRATASQENAWRFRWHALESCRILLKAFYRTGEDEYLYMAREHATHWIAENLHRQTDDMRYAWYDHGTALRCLSLLAIWDLGQERRFDVLTLSDLLEALHAHGELLASETFVARNQPYREHNHALFQAIALLFLGRVAPLPEASRWAALGAERCTDLIAALVTEEGVCAENSSDYHTGLARLVAKLQDVFSGYGLEDGGELLRIYRSMKGFESVFRYPNGTSPAIGDSWHFSEAAADSRRDRRSPEAQDDSGQGGWFYPQSGYAILRRGEAGGHPTRQLNLICSAVNVTHKHADQLSFTFWADGIEWVADPGLYKYGESDLHARYFRHARAHNAVVLNDESYPPAAGNAKLVRWSDSAAATNVTAEHRGYENALVRRSIRYEKADDRVQIVDEVHGAGVTSCALWFHAGLGVHLDVGVHGDVLLVHEQADTAVLVVPAWQCSDLETFAGQSDPFAAGWIYTRGGTPVPSRSWRYGLPVDELPCTTFLLPGTRERLAGERQAIVENARTGSAAGLAAATETDEDADALGNGFDRVGGGKAEPSQETGGRD